MKLKLPSVTLVMQETREHKLALLAVEDCVKKVDFAEVLIFTDRPLEFTPLTHICNPRIITVDDWPSKLDWCRFSWFGVPMHIRTAFMLCVQWDAGIWSPDMWRDEFLQYDYGGAPWWYPVKNVGNSGFCLKSTRLARYIYNNRYVYQCDSVTEDDLLCRKYRPQLEDKGFLWMPESVAYDFAYEGCGPAPVKEPSRHFGFHAMHNWPRVFDRDELTKRIALASESPYVRESYMMQNFCRAYPELMKDIIESNIEGKVRVVE